MVNNHLGTDHKGCYFHAECTCYWYFCSKTHENNKRTILPVSSRELPGRVLNHWSAASCISTKGQLGVKQPACKCVGPVVLHLSWLVGGVVVMLKVKVLRQWVVKDKGNSPSMTARMMGHWLKDSSAGGLFRDKDF